MLCSTLVTSILARSIRRVPIPFAGAILATRFAKVALQIFSDDPEHFNKCRGPGGDSTSVNSSNVNNLFTWFCRNYRAIVRWLVMTVSMFFCALTLAAPVWLGYSDIAPGGFTVSIQSDEPILLLTPRVFSDMNASSEVTATLSIKPSPADVPAFLAQGLGSYRVGNAQTNFSYYAQFEVQTASGTYLLPGPAGSLQPVQTANALQSLTPADQLDLNALVSFDLAAAIANTHSILSLQTSAMTSPLIQLSDGPKAYFDLNNAIDVSGNRLSLAAGELVALNQYFGVNCASEVALTRYRRVTASADAGSAQAIVPLEACFFADIDCNSSVTNADVDLVRQRMFQAASSCGFNPDLDIVSDDTINVLDFQSVLNRLGQSEPFE